MSDYLEVTGLAGPVLASGYRGAFDITGFSFKADAQLSFSAGGPQVATPDFGAITVDFADASGLTSFLSTFTHGSALNQLSLVETGALGRETLRINLADARIGEVQTDQAGYHLTLDYTQIGVITPTVLPSGSPGTPETFGYNLVTNIVGAAPPNAVVTSAVTPVDPAKFYLLIDGVAGDSQDSAHTGWFELSQFDVQTLVQLVGASHGGGGVAPHAGPLELTIDTSPAIADLLRAMANGQLIQGARIEGVTAGANPTAIYDLDLANVAVTHLGQDDSGATHLDLTFGAFQLKTTGVDPKTGLPSHPTFASWDFVGQVGSVTLPNIAPGAGVAGDVHPTTYYLDAATIHGSSTDALYQGALKLANFSFAANATMNLGGAGLSSGKLQFDEVTVSFADKAGLADFLADLTQGRTIDNLSLVGTQLDPRGGHEVDTYRLNLGNVHVTSVNETDGEGYSVSLGYTAIGVITHPFQADGSLGAAVSFGYDIPTAQVVQPPTSIAAAGGATTPLSAEKYFLLIDGVNGGSTDPDHRGWFELSAYDLQAFKSFSVGASTGIREGKTTADPLDLTVTSSTALSQLLDKLAAGLVIHGARIEGVDVGLNGVTRVASELNLADVFITHVGQNDSGSTDLSLAFGGFSLATTSSRPNGDLVTSPPVSWNFETGSPSVTLPNIAPSDTTAFATKATDFYFTATGLHGDALTAGYAGALHVTSFQFATDTTTSLDTSGGAAGAGKPEFGPLTLTFSNETGLYTFLHDVAQGTSFNEASLVGVRALRTGAQEVYRLNLAHAGVTDVHMTADGGYSVTLDYTQMGVSTSFTDSQGSLQPPQVFGYDLIHDETIGLPPAAGAQAGVAPTQASTFYLLVDGVNGGSTDAGHVGWFKISGFDLDAFNHATVVAGTGGAGAGKAASGPVSVELDGNSGLTDLLQALAKGHALAGARIEGVSAGSHPTVVFGLDLVDVAVSHVGVVSDGDPQLNLQFGAFKLTTIGIGSDGHPTSSQITAWSFEANSPTVDVAPIAPGDGGSGGGGGGSGPPQPPSAPTGLVLDPASDTGQLGDHLTSLHSVVIDGSAQAGVTVAIREGGTVLGTTAADSNGNFQVAVTLGEGAHSLTATAIDAAGTSSSASTALGVTVDSTAPDAPSALALDPASDTGVPGDGRTAASQLSIDGHAEAGASVTLYDGQTAVGTGVADGSGQFQIATAALANGAHTLTATATDAAGNVSAVSPGLSISIDTLALAPDTGSHVLAEQTGVTGATAVDATAATLAFSDADASATHTAQAGAASIVWSGGDLPASALSALGSGLITTSVADGAGAGAVTVSLQAPDSAFDFLGAGETLTVTSDVTVSGSSGGSDHQTITFTVTGANDVPVLAAGGTAAATVAEQAATLGSTALDQASGVVTFHDPDLDDRPSVSVGDQSVVAHSATGATFALSAAQTAAFAAGFHVDALAGATNDATLNWNYAVEDRALDFLGAGESVTVTTTVQVDDHHGGTLVQPVTITLQGANDAPVAVGDLAAVARGGSLAVDRAHGVLANDTDPDLHDTLQVTAVNGQAAGGAVAGAYGVLTLRADGSYAYAAAKTALLPASGVGQDTFTYQVGDGHGGVASQTLTVTVYAGNGATYLSGQPGVTLLAGGNGKHILDAGVGGHVLVGGNGADVLLAGYGADTMTGGNGPDVFVFGHSGFGDAVITDFANPDSVQFDHRLFANFADLVSHAAQVGRDVVITFDAHDTITLQGVALNSLRSADFLFV